MHLIIHNGVINDQNPALAWRDLDRLKRFPVRSVL